VLLQPPGRAVCRKCWILCAVGGEVYGHYGARRGHSAEHGAVDDGDAVRKQQATIAVWRLLKGNDTVLLRCVVSFL
jgi:predicted DCC family thiol-disulfide oxidoreductase YuxK